MNTSWWAAPFKKWGPFILLGLLSFPSGILWAALGSTLMLRLKEGGLSLKYVSLVGLFHLFYFAKCFWIPFLDRYSFPLTPQRWPKPYSWVVGLLVCAVFGLSVFAVIDFHLYPLSWVAAGAFLAFVSASYDATVAASQMGFLEEKHWGTGVAVCTSGFRVGILTGGAGMWALSVWLSWTTIYLVMAGIIAVTLGLSILLFPYVKIYLHGNVPPARTLKESFIAPLRQFSRDHGRTWIVILAFMALYRLQDFLQNPMLPFFFMSCGYSKVTVAQAYKSIGMVIAMLGSFIGGFFVLKLGYARTLVVGSVVHSMSSLGLLLVKFCTHPFMFYSAIALEEVSKGIMLPAFFAYQMMCCHPAFAMTQLSLITSIVDLSNSLLSSVSGFLAQGLGWPAFLILSGAGGSLALFLVRFLPFRSSVPSSPALSEHTLE